MVASLGGVLNPCVNDIRPYLHDLDPIIAENLLALGIVDYHDLVSRVVFGRVTRHRVLRNTSYESAQESHDRPAFTQHEDTGIVLRRRLVPSVLVPRADDLDDEVAAPQPRAVSTGAMLPLRRIFKGFSVSTSGHTLRPRRSLFHLFERKVD